MEEEDEEPKDTYELLKYHLHR